MSEWWFSLFGGGGEELRNLSSQDLICGAFNSPNTSRGREDISFTC